MVIVAYCFVNLPIVYIVDRSCGACIVGFNVKGGSTGNLSAAQGSVKVFHHRVIYHLLEDIGNLIVEKAPGVSEMEVSGEAEVLSIFKILGKRRTEEDGVNIAGCKVMDGRVCRSGLMHESASTYPTIHHFATCDVYSIFFGSSLS
ncbi:unnamed protein product [Arabidopsis thaliana]|uniref:(thale cress) hypothetical protein n=1 Tax=Arabidopsis thaliana TaxID=3702 RepID=A0A7G2F178_ARATH|nr:unnamed protein product [Arabidopsis thaliana]